MKIRPESWLLNKDRSVLLNVDNGKAIKRKENYFEICNSATDPEGYCRIIGNKTVIAEGSDEKYFVDDLLYAKLERIFREGFDYSDYNLF